MSKNNYKELLDEAIETIINFTEDNCVICENVPEDEKKCPSDCDGKLKKECVMRYLKYRTSPEGHIMKAIFG